MNIGLLGGGQLGRMMIQAAHGLGHRVTVLDPDASGPAAQLADEVIVGAYDDPAALQQLARAAQVFTTEFENVPADSLRFLALHGQTFPSAACVERAQDRRVEKAFMAEAGVTVAPYAVLNSVADLAAVPEDLFPGILKTARMGYDGKGQVRVSQASELVTGFADLGGVACVFEAQLPLAQEVSVILARTASGELAIFPVGENVHRQGILDTTTVPAQISVALAEAARASAQRIAEAMDYVGVLCVEFFILRDGRLVANEMAPRPHNSGHYTIEACETSQFEQQVRICAGMPLGPTGLRFPVRMTNLLGDLWFPQGPQAEPVEPNWAMITAQPGACLHLYGKSSPRMGRKMGHLTVPLAD